MIKKKGLLAAFLATLLCFGCTTSKNRTSENAPVFIIKVEQDGAVVSPVNNVITLKKKPFKFNVKIKEKTEGVFLTATWDDFMYNFPSDKNIFYCVNNKYEDACGFVDGMTMATDLYNSDKSIIVGDKEAQQYWYYDKKDERYRFDKGVVVERGWIKATFTVEKIWDRLVDDDDNKEFDISNIDRDIYFVFAGEEVNKKTKLSREVQREKFIIKFE